MQRVLLSWVGLLCASALWFTSCSGGGAGDSPSKQLSMQDFLGEYSADLVSIDNDTIKLLFAIKINNDANNLLNQALAVPDNKPYITNVRLQDSTQTIALSTIFGDLNRPLLVNDVPIIDKTARALQFSWVDGIIFKADTPPTGGVLKGCSAIFLRNSRLRDGVIALEESASATGKSSLFWQISGVAGAPASANEVKNIIKKS